MNKQEMIDYRISDAMRFPYDETDAWWDQDELPPDLPNMEHPAWLAARAIANMMSSVAEPQMFSHLIKEKIRREQIRKMAYLIDAVYSGNYQLLEADVDELPMSLEPKLVYIPGGTFLMGSPDGEGNKDEYPQHEVTIQPFYMGKYPITQAEYLAVMGKNPSHFVHNPDYPNKPNNPVEQVSCYDADKFCKRLSKLTGRNYRLPTESEWEYACRAGTTTKYYFGDDKLNLDAYAWHLFNSEKQTHPVGKKKPNQWGLYDMYGNVCEWCADTWHSNYEGAPTNGSTWTTGGNSNHQIIRGGCWDFNPNGCRSALRFIVNPDLRSHYVGLRVACAASRSL